MPRDYTSRHSIALLELRLALTFDDKMGCFLCRIET